MKVAESIVVVVLIGVCRKSRVVANKTRTTVVTMTKRHLGALLGRNE